MKPSSLKVTIQEGLNVASKYRFKILNGCRVVDSFPFTAVFYNVDYSELSFVTSEPNITVGSYIKIDGLQEYGIGNNVYVPIISSASPGQVTIANIFGNALPNGSEGTLYVLEGYRTVNPLDFFTSKFTWNKENEEVFFRKNMPDQLTFSGDDFNYFRDYVLTNECCEMKFVVEKKCSSGWAVEWEGYFSHTNCKWDFANCKVTVSFDTDDKYRCLFEGITDNYDIFNGVIQFFETIECTNPEVGLSTAPPTTCASPCVGLPTGITDAGGNVVQFTSGQYLDPCDGSLYTDWQLFKNVITQKTFTGFGSELFEITTTWIREVAITQDVAGVPVSPSGSGWVMRESVNYNGYPAHKWTRWPYDGAYYFYSDYTIDYDDCQGMPCVRVWRVNFPDALDLNERSVSLGDTIQDLATVICNQIKGVRSDFLEINPPGDTPGYTAGNNYVTGTTNKLNNLRLLRVSDFATNYAQTDMVDIFSEISLRELLEAISMILNVRWVIDSDSYLRIEHISWFSLGSGVSAITGYSGLLNKGKYAFEFEKQNIPFKEEWKFTYAGYKDFLGLPIKYSSQCANQSLTTTYQVPKLSTDVKHIRDHANEYSDFNSFVLMACDADNFILDEAGVLTGEVFENGHLSLANVHHNYHQDNRYLPAGEMNGSPTTFTNTRRIKIERGIAYQAESGCCADIDAMTNYVTTRIGNGRIDKMERTLRDEIYNLDLLHE